MFEWICWCKICKNENIIKLRSCAPTFMKLLVRIKTTPMTPIAWIFISKPIVSERHYNWIFLFFISGKCLTCSSPTFFFSIFNFVIESACCELPWMSFLPLGMFFSSKLSGWWPIKFSSSCERAPLHASLIAITTSFDNYIRHAKQQFTWHTWWVVYQHYIQQDYIYISMQFCKCKKQHMKRKLNHEIECEFGEHVYLYGNVSSL